MNHANARTIWSAHPTPAGTRVDSVLFRRGFTLDAVPASAALHLFASTNYRLRVNGAIVAHGPVRFVPGHEHFDTIDLASHLRPGENAVVVEVRFIDANNFQSMPGDRGRFVAWGHVGTINLGTPGDWTARRCHAWRDDAPAFSFAIGPAEVLDVAAHVAALSANAGGPPADLGQAGTLAPRAIPSPTDDVLTPQALFAAPLLPGGPRVGAVSLGPSFATESGGDKQFFRYATFLHSDAAGPATLLLHWGPHWLNGDELRGQDDPLRGNCQRFDATLRAGWNLLCGRPGQPHSAAPLLIEGPPGVRFRSTPDLADDFALRLLPPSDDDAWLRDPPAHAEALDLTDPAWRRVRRDEPPPCPAREVAWDRPNDEDRVESPALPIERGAGGWMALFDFGTEFLGRLTLDLDAPAGTVVDLAYDERLRDDGCLGLFATNPFIETSDRFVWPGGRASVETFLPRGGRFVQLVVRANEPTTLHALACRDARCLPAYGGAFACDDELFNWTWHAGLRTLRASLEDTFCDSPWRERGAYLGDSYVQTAVHLVTSPDRTVPRGALRLFADGRRDDGQLPGVVPAWLRKPHGDFSLIYAIWLRDWWARTGDLDTVRHCLPAAEGVLRSATWTRANGAILWDATVENRLFIDWGCDKAARVGRANGVANAFRVRALQCVAELREALGQDGAAFAAEASDVRAAFQNQLWRGDRFAMSADSEAPCLHVNLLALAFDLADDDQAEPLLAHCLDRLATNAQRAAEGGRHDDFAELYFLKYALDGLARVGRFAEAERAIADHFAFLRDANADCLWECLHRGINGQGSLCHSWSAAPVEYLARHVLGVREAVAGDPDRVTIDPHAVAPLRAEGTIPHPHGPLHVRWQRRDDGTLDLRAIAPRGVRLTSPHEMKEMA